MIRITANRDMKFTGYGLRLVAGEPVEIERAPYGLRKSLERHEKAGHLTVDWDAVPTQAKPLSLAVAAPVAPVAQVVTSAPETPAEADPEPEPKVYEAEQVSVFVAGQEVHATQAVDSRPVIIEPKPRKRRRRR